MTKTNKEKLLLRNETINVDVAATKDCNDFHCPFHGKLRFRGMIFSGTVISAKTPKSITVEWRRTKYLQKYERYAIGRTRVKAHNPSCINVKEGEKVLIAECRPISKTKHFVVIKRL